MRLMSTVLFSSMIALGAAGAAMAQETTAQPPGQAPAGAPADHRLGPPGGPPRAGGAPLAQGGPRSPPSEGGVVGTIDSMSSSGFEIATAAGRKVNVATSASTTYRNGKASISAAALKSGDSVAVLGIVGFGAQGLAASTVTASHVIVRPAGATIAAPAEPLQRGAPAPAKKVGQVPADYVEGSGTIVNGTEADKALEAAMASPYYFGGLVNRVVKVKDGVYEAHQVTVSWPHHIFVDKDFKAVGAF